MGTCMECDGTGHIVTCIDDVCVGQGYCIHGDGEDVCPSCGGLGETENDDDELDSPDWESDLRKENARLRAELDAVRAERDALKKALK